MTEELIKDKVYYKIFNRLSKDLTRSRDINKVIADFSAKNILLLNQVHGNNVIDTGNLQQNDVAERPEGDASVTMDTGTILGIRTADCVPVLLASDDGKVIGAAHCGWRGARLDIIQRLVDAMRQQNPHNESIVAIVGPSIKQESYEVSPEYYQEFLAESQSFEQFFDITYSDGKKRYLFDLPSFVKMKLVAVNVKIVKHVGEDTYTMDGKYPSYRRSAHTGEAYEHCILSTIVKTGNGINCLCQKYS